MTRRLRVLIVDDHPGIVKALSRLLSWDYDVVGSVADGSGLLETVQQLQPDVIVLDLNLPKVDGLEACRRVRKASPQTKVIVFTGVDDPNVRRRAFEAGAAAFVDKLGIDGDLLSAIQRLGAPEEPAS